MPQDRAALIPVLHNIATQLRVDSIRSTTAAESGHPSTCASAADLIAALFFAEMRFDPKHPLHPLNDRFVLSKGHAAPILYAAWAAVGYIKRDDLLNLRKLDSDLEGHPTPRLPFVDVATGSLGQGLAAALGAALNAQRIGSDYRTYALLGDGETAEGSVWEAAELAAFKKVDNLVGITDVNRLGQSRPTMWQHDLDGLARRWSAFGWNAIVINGHDLNAILDAYAAARATKGRPTMILAKTFKGYGVSFVQDKEGWHGKALKAGDEENRAIAELEKTLNGVPADAIDKLRDAIPKPPAAPAETKRRPARSTCLQVGRRGRQPRGVRHRARTSRQGRQPYRGAGRRRGQFDVQRALRESRARTLLRELHRRAGHGGRRDGTGCARRDSISVDVRVLPDARLRFPAHGGDQQSEHQAGWFTRGRVDRRGRTVADGAGRSGDDACRAKLHRALSERCGVRGAVRRTGGRTSRDRSTSGRAGRKRQSSTTRTKPSPSADPRCCGSPHVTPSPWSAPAVTLFEALKAFDLLAKDGIAIRVIDLYSVQPVDADTLLAAARATDGRVVTVEDHYAAGGIGDAVATALAPGGFTVHRLAVREIPRSGKPEELLDRFGISAAAIVNAVKAVTSDRTAAKV